MEPGRIDTLLHLEAAPTETHEPAPCWMPEMKAFHQQSGSVSECPAGWRVTPY